MKILVTGSEGQLGKCISAIKHNYENYEFIFRDKDLDITKEKDLENFFCNENIDFVINCAAYTRVDDAESELQEAERINVLGVKYLALMSSKYLFKLIHISTDFVFDGIKSFPYIEDDEPNPINIYGKTKLLAEEEVEKYAYQYMIIRTAWLYSIYGNNFLKTIIRLSKDKKDISIVFDQVGTPTNAGDLANIILDLIPFFEKGKNQVYHYSNEGVASWYDFAEEISNIMNLKMKILPITSNEYITRAKRPYYSVLNKSKIKFFLDVEILHWKKSLKKCIKDL